MTPRSPKSPKPRAPSISSLEKQLSKKGAGRAPSKAMLNALYHLGNVASMHGRSGFWNAAVSASFRTLARELRSRAQRGARKGK